MIHMRLFKLLGWLWFDVLGHYKPLAWASPEVRTRARLLMFGATTHLPISKVEIVDLTKKEAQPNV